MPFRVKDRYISYPMYFLMLNIFSDKIFITKHSIMIEIKYKAVYYLFFLENSVKTKVSFSYVAYSIFLSSNLRYKTKL